MTEVRAVARGIYSRAGCSPPIVSLPGDGIAPRAPSPRSCLRPNSSPPWPVPYFEIPVFARFNISTCIHHGQRRALRTATWPMCQANKRAHYTGGRYLNISTEETGENWNHSFPHCRTSKVASVSLPRQKAPTSARITLADLRGYRSHAPRARAGCDDTSERGRRWEGGGVLCVPLDASHIFSLQKSLYRSDLAVPRSKRVSLLAHLPEQSYDNNVCV